MKINCSRVSVTTAGSGDGVLPDALVIRKEICEAENGLRVVVVLISMYLTETVFRDIQYCLKSLAMELMKAWTIQRFLQENDTAMNVEKLGGNAGFRGTDRSGISSSLRTRKCADSCEEDMTNCKNFGDPAVIRKIPLRPVILRSHAFVWDSPFRHSRYIYRVK